MIGSNVSLTKHDARPPCHATASACEMHLLHRLTLYVPIAAVNPCNMWAQHGGGYLYSVCPKSEPLTESCFSSPGRVLPFIGTTHTIRYLDGRPELQIPARDVDVGTFPPASTWRLNPVPACNCDRGNGCAVSPLHGEVDEFAYTDGSEPVPHVSCAGDNGCASISCPTGTQFPPPFHYAYGQQLWELTPEATAAANNSAAANTWVIVDTVRAPATAGEYVLRWRWDVEQNPQIWTHCADITVV